jgi:aryl-alcohol dehydrogenase-like predicted oxidoreductase
VEQRSLGNSGLRVSLVGLGCNNFGRRIDYAASRPVVHKALDLGITFFDTADIYRSPIGGSEEFLGQALGPRRKDVVLATKVSMATDESGLRSASRRTIISGVEASLRRLNTDWIDLYQQHQPDPLTPVEETLRAFDDLVRQGKVRYIGCSNLRAWQVVEALWMSRSFGLASFVSCQNEYSLLMRHPDRELIPMMQAYGMGLLPYYPLASGLLTGKYRRNAPMPGGRAPDGAQRPLRGPLHQRHELAYRRTIGDFRRATGPEPAGTCVQLARRAALRVKHHRRRHQAGAVGGEQPRRVLGTDRGGTAGDRPDHRDGLMARYASPASLRARIVSSQCRPSNGCGRSLSTSTPSRQRALTLTPSGAERGT